MFDLRFSSRGRTWFVVLVAMMLAATVGLSACGGGGSSANTASAVSLEAANAPGADPFTGSVASGPAIAFPGNVRAITLSMRNRRRVDGKTHTFVAAGTAPGLYGGSGDTHVCDPDKLVSYLDRNSEKADAWARVLGIDSKGIAAYVKTLTPVVLTTDTLVTNHGYADGQATSLQSVLEAGTAVMVDATGTPRVKCNCGNPLASPEPIAVTKTRGTPWPGYKATAVTVIKPGPATKTLTLIDSKTGDYYQQPVGASKKTGKTGKTGKTNRGEFVAAVASAASSRTLIFTSRDGGTWSRGGAVPSASVSALAWGNGKWLAFESSRESGTAVVESADLQHWNTVAHVPDFLAGATYNNGRWIAVGWVNVHGTSTDPLAGEFPPAAVYSSTNGVAWARVASIPRAAPFSSVAYAGGRWIAVGINLHQGDIPSSTYVSTNGSTWTRQRDAGLNQSVSAGLIAFGAGRWALGGLDISPGHTSGVEGGVVALSSDAVNWTLPPGGHLAGDEIFGIAYGNGEWLATAGRGDVFSSSGGETWARRGHLAGTAELAFGGTSATSGLAPAPTTTPTPAPTTTTRATTTTTQVSSALERIDWKNFTYEDFACLTHQPVKYTNGTWVAPGTKGKFDECSMTFTAVEYADVTGDGIPDAVVSLHGSASAFLAGQSDVTTVFTAGPNGPVNHGYIDGPSFPPYSAAAGITIWIRHPAPTDPLSRPSQYEKDRYAYSSATGNFAKVQTAYVPAGELPKR